MEYVVTNYEKSFKKERLDLLSRSLMLNLHINVGERDP